MKRQVLLARSPARFSPFLNSVIVYDSRVASDKINKNHCVWKQWIAKILLVAAARSIFSRFPSLIFANLLLWKLYIYCIKTNLTKNHQILRFLNIAFGGCFKAIFAMSRNLIVLSMVRHWQLGMVKNSKKHKISQQTINRPPSDLQRAPRDPQGTHEGP